MTNALITTLTPIIAAITVLFLKEYSKALTCSLLGDTTIKEEGRLSLNPFKYIEPIGLILLINFGTLGWGRPVETKKYRYKKPREAIIIAAIVPLLTLLSTGVLAAYLINMTITTTNIYVSFFLATFLFSVMSFSFGLLVVNLIVPLFPFEASGILKSFISPNQAINFGLNEKTYLFMLVLLFFMLGGTVNRFFHEIVMNMMSFFINIF